MKINDHQLARFRDMVQDFSMRNGLTVEIKTDLKGTSDIRFSKNGQWKGYVVTWSEVRSLTDAGTAIFADAMNYFGLNKYETHIDPFEIKDVIFNNPATIVLWADGTKTVVKCQEDDIYSEEIGLALCFAKKALGNKGNYNNVFKKWIPEEKPDIQFDTSALFGDGHSLAQEVMQKFKDALNKNRQRGVEEV